MVRYERLLVHAYGFPRVGFSVYPGTVGLFIFVCLRTGRDVVVDGYVFRI